MINLLKSFKSVKNYQYQKTDIASAIFCFTYTHKIIIDLRIERYLSAESKSYSWEELKTRARSAVKKQDEKILKYA